MIDKLINYLELKENTDKSKILLISQYSKDLEKADNLGINKIGSDNYSKAEEATEQDPNKRNSLTLISSEETT
ncbi:hypothetical protein [Rickettsiella massiliensis]|uniref:hypothetical protein n=1 Tax=Rickettsiella massiliensis TaxID=676517 RepID=UPI00029A9B9E|nr:hypothetical protein [Rickettsiella massiliensis]